MALIKANRKITLEEIGIGQTGVNFDHAMRQVVENIKDPYTSLKKRKIIIKIGFTPIDNDREDIRISTQVISDLVNQDPCESKGVLDCGVNGIYSLLSDSINFFHQDDACATTDDPPTNTETTSSGENIILDQPEIDDNI